ncbi:acetate CoA/acetoacetate CoA-transferase alpha subunit [Gibbsiella quercinecans]|uniref:Branched-chain amino acid dehydrogenase n=1 Tax=Gibbsiella quercinecans TaxID=929813 RepID=A0A250B4A5_9GAMM|nr:3-oxoacid CoA-transferase subunit A [Gibbsiella quercinecans]ATA21078.1 branched-chain amino acid dehydrogenase [Gibbsiella quercinecans]RLM08449.1 branched-chain amino acid dehydrogenase [Gibbsiella quercinecans]RLM11724.1 branched-chain amino acid dehydrogenase [Gibbsiella quercinecans]TCT86738.1 acetate CoA/acetoacetate CoA-transferase alpha subunit [Gibbsiella quercinecans]
MASKFALPEEIIALFKDGQTLMCGGFANHGVPNRLIDCVIASGARHFTLISNDSGDANLTIGRLIHHGLVDKLIASHIGRNTETVALVAAGKIALELVPQGSLAERMRCGGSGLGGVLTKTGLSTVVDKGKQHIEVDGEEWLLETPLRADIGLVRARTADPLGNLTYRGTMRNFNPLVAKAANLTLVDADIQVDVGELGVESIVTPGVYVNKILKLQGERQ